MTALDPVRTDDGSVFLRREALAAGYSEREISQLTRNGTWHRLRRGAYVDQGVWTAADTSRRHALLARAVLKQACTEVVLSHVSALPVYGAPVWGMPLDHVHVTRRDRRAGRKEAGVRQHQGVLLPDDVVCREGFEVTSPTRTALDITTVASTEASLCVVNFLLHSELTTADKLRRRYTSMQQHPFTLRTDLVLRLADSRVESVGESRALFLCWRQGLPIPVPQFVVEDAGRVVARLDFAWPELGAWIEFDGRGKYTMDGDRSAVDRVLKEKQREDRVRELTGWRCLRITWADLADPERLAARIRVFLFGPDAS